MTSSELLTYLACAFWLGMLASMAYGITTGDGVPLGLCLLAMIGLAPRILAESDAEGAAHDAIEKARRAARRA